MLQDRWPTKCGASGLSHKVISYEIEKDNYGYVFLLFTWSIFVVLIATFAD